MRIARTTAIALLAPIVLGSSPDSAAPIGRASVESSSESSSTSSVETTRSRGGRIEKPAAPPPVAHERSIPELTPAELNLLQSAIDQFAVVGLDVPDVDVQFHDDTEPCDGHDGVFDGDGPRPLLHICVADRGTAASDLWRRRTLIHELAHAWEHVNLTDQDRSELLAVLEADRWFGNDLPWHDRGGERFAETIVWGLYDQLRRPVKVDVSCRKLHADFQLITGHTAIGAVEKVCRPAGIEE